MSINPNTGNIISSEGTYQVGSQVLSTITINKNSQYKYSKIYGKFSYHKPFTFEVDEDASDEDMLWKAPLSIQCSEGLLGPSSKGLREYGFRLSTNTLPGSSQSSQRTSVFATRESHSRPTAVEPTSNVKK
jgi:hypothetical protein